MFMNAFRIWFVIALMAVISGAALEKFIRPRCSEKVRHVLSTIALCAISFLFSCIFIGWMGAQTRRDAFLAGPF